MTVYKRTGDKSISDLSKPCRYEVYVDHKLFYGMESLPFDQEKEQKDYHKILDYLMGEYEIPNGTLITIKHFVQGNMPITVFTYLA